MSARRLGRLLGTTLMLFALAATAVGLQAGSTDATMHTDDYEWSAKPLVAVVDGSFSR
jgi:hypothetical protein